MAWDPNASPWNWDTGAVLLQSQGGDVWKHVESTPTIAAAGDGQFFVQHGGPHNGLVCPISSSMGPTFSCMNEAVVSNTGGGETVFPSLEPTRLPVVTDSIGSEPLSIGWNDAYQGQDPGKVGQKRVSDNRERADDSHAGLLELKSHDYKQQQAVTNSKETVGNLIQTKHYEDKSSTEQQGRPLIHAGKTAKDTKDESGTAQLTGEQHNSMATGSAGSGESLIGLHLGKRAYFQDATAATGTKATQKPNPAPKRSRAAGMQTPCCQVEGCKTDLTSAKDYHRRHKVCEPHSKAGKVTVANQEQRFCQQCSRFHLLAEFDEAKRSCRRRLAGHNERRRKPQPDPLALHARLQFSYQGWPFLQHPRFLETPSLWQSTFDYRSTGTWPRTTRFEDRPIYDRIVQAPSMEREFHSKGLSHHTDDTLPLFLLQSPKEMMPIDLSHTNEKFSLHEYLSGSVGPVNNGLTLASSSPGAGVLSGLEATPATELVTRVTDSGCALSLLSPQTRDSYDAPDIVSLDLLGRTSIAIDQLMNEDNAPQQLLQGQQQHGYDYSTEKLLSAMVPNSQDHSSACSLPAGWMVSVDKNHFEGSIMHGLNGDCSLEGHPLLAEFQGHHNRGPEDVKQTIDLMRISSQPQHGTPEEQSMSFHLGGCAFGDLQYTYESAF